MVALVTQLVADLQREGLPQCHWKGGAALAAGLRGERDLDFLVPPEAFVRAEAVLGACGFVAARSRFGADAPGTAHHFGFQPGLERLLHVHLHDRVLSGEDLITSHALPFGEAMLASPRFADGVRIPTPALETALTVLKHAIRWGSLPDRLAAHLRPRNERDALRQLLTETNIANAAAIVATSCPAVDVACFEACARVLREAGGGARERRQLSARVRRALEPFRTPSGKRRWRSYVSALEARVRRLLDGDRRDKALRGEGVSIAFLGSAAAERASRVSEIARWLGQAFAVRVAAATAAAGPFPGEIVLVDGEPARGCAAERIDLHETQAGDALRRCVWDAL
jgi:hypothetical protein